MAKKKNVLGAWAFLIGVIIALVIGILGARLSQGTNENLALALVVIGVIIGLLNVGGEELKDFMMAGTVIVVVSALGGAQAYLGGISSYLSGIVSALVAMFVPATLVVALKAIFVIAKK